MLIGSSNNIVTNEGSNSVLVGLESSIIIECGGNGGGPSIDDDVGVVVVVDVAIVDLPPTRFIG